MNKLRSLFSIADLPTKLVLLVFTASLPAFGVTIYSAQEAQRNVVSSFDSQGGIGDHINSIRATLDVTLGRDLMLLVIFMLLGMIAAWCVGYMLDPQARKDPRAYLAPDRGGRPERA